MKGYEKESWQLTAIFKGCPSHLKEYAVWVSDDYNKAIFRAPIPEKVAEQIQSQAIMCEYELFENGYPEI